MRRFLYGRALQFSVGTTTQPEMPNSIAAICSREKKKASDALQNDGSDGRRVEAKLMLQHFRDCMNPSGWYSLPIGIFSATQVRPLVHALTTSIPGQEKTSALLPLSKGSDMLSIRDREEFMRQPQPSTSPFLVIQPEPDVLPRSQVAGAEDSTICTPTQGQRVPKDMLSQEMLLFASESSGLIVFRVSDKRPALKKRPLSYADSLSREDFCLRLYRVEHATETLLTVTALEHSEVPLAKLFSSNAALELINSMHQWQKPTAVDSVLTIQQDDIGETAFNFVQDVLSSGAIAGSSIHFETAGLTLAEDQIVDGLLKKSVLLRTQNGAAVQLSPNVLSSQLVLSGKLLVFQPRVGSTYKYDRINLAQGASRPTQWELYWFLQRDGWHRKTWQGTAKQLKKTFCEGGGPKEYFHDGYWYWLALLNRDALHALGLKLVHGQLESFYQAAISLGQNDPSKLSGLLPGKAAASYKSASKSGEQPQRQPCKPGFFLEIIVDDDIDGKDGQTPSQQLGCFFSIQFS